MHFETAPFLLFGQPFDRIKKNDPEAAMKFLHLSDLHLGRRLKETSLLEDQAFILQRILELVDEEQPHAVIIAGDVYDKTVPSAEAVTLLDGFLCALAERRVPTLIISGNHDSAERLAFGGRLLEGSGIHLSPVYNGKVEPITLQDEYGEVDFWLLPFIKPIHVRHHFPKETVESYTDACRTAISHMAVDPARRNVLVTHQFVTGAQVCESEEAINVGGTDNVDASVFDGFHYVALGHIHGPQNIGSSRIRYCGTPLKYSFSEADHYKSVTVAELDGEGKLQLRLLPLIPRHDLRILKGSFAQLTDQAFWKNTVTDDYLHIILTDEEDIPEAVSRLDAIYPNILHLSYDNTRTRTEADPEDTAGGAELPPLELFETLYRRFNGQAMSQVQRRFVADLIERIQEGQP